MFEESKGPAAELARLDAKVAEISRRFERLDRALRQKILTVESDSRHVRVRINGMAEIIELVVAPDALRDPHVHGLGAAVVQTIGNARARARKLREAAKAKVFADMDDMGRARA
ncbi:YbaB/EbfC family nucleoid-associated protein [Spirillospora sp. CA-255316]